MSPFSAPFSGALNRPTFGQCSSSSEFSFLVRLIGSSRAFPFCFFCFLAPSVSFCFRGRERYAPEAKVSFLSSLVSSPSAAQAAAKDLWSSGLLPPAEEEVQSAMANRSPGLLSGYLRASKGNLRNARRVQASLPSAASRLRPAQRGFRSKMAAAAEIDACKSHKP
jgi:hypothetical protein